MTNTRRWVSAAPFRAHLEHLCAGTEVPWTVVALSAGLPLGLAAQLLDVRSGRRVQRIAPEFARQVIAVTPEQILALSTTLVPARSAGQAIRRLRRLGWTPQALARAVRVSIAEVDALEHGLRPTIPALLDLRLAALLATSGSPSGPAPRSTSAA